MSVEQGPKFPEPLGEEPKLKQPWEMTEDEFKRSAERGRGHADEAQDIRDVADGTKPMAVIACPPHVELPGVVELKKPDIRDKVEYRFFSHPTGQVVAVVAKKGTDIDQLVAQYRDLHYAIDPKSGELSLKRGRETPMGAIEQGNFYGYSIDDINSYLSHRFGYRSVIEDAVREGKPVSPEIVDRFQK